MSNIDTKSENRASFFRRLEPFFVPSDLLDVELAYTLAKFGHRSQVRKELNAEGVPLRYFEHVRRVVIVMLDEARIVDPTMTKAALLHDGIEDTRDLTPALIQHCFGPEVCQIVKVLSKDPKEGYLERFMTSTDWRPYVIKACDRLDNLRSLSSASDEFKSKQINETQDKYFALFDRMMSLVPSEYHSRAQWLRDAIREETLRQRVMLEFKRQ